MLFKGGESKRKPTPLDPFIKLGVPFGVDTDIEAEHKRAKSEFPYSDRVAEMTEQLNKRRKKMIRGNIAVVSETQSQQQQQLPSHHKDPFTCMCQATFTYMCFCLPDKEPDPEKDDPALVRDVEFFKECSQPGGLFESVVLTQECQKIRAFLNEFIFTLQHPARVVFESLESCPELLIDRSTKEEMTMMKNARSAISNMPISSAEDCYVATFGNANQKHLLSINVTADEARFLATVHVALHFKLYLKTIIERAVHPSDLHNKGLIEAWYDIFGKKAAVQKVSFWVKKSNRTGANANVQQHPLKGWFQDLYRAWLAIISLANAIPKQQQQE